MTHDAVPMALHHLMAADRLKKASVLFIGTSAATPLAHFCISMADFILRLFTWKRSMRAWRWHRVRQVYVMLPCSR